MSDYVNPAKFAHVKADVSWRRRAYFWFIITVVAVFLISIADIIWWNEVLEYVVYGAILVLLVWAIILLFAAVIKNAWSVGEVVLSCPECEHVFLYGAEHADNKGHARMTCPVCSFAGELPISQDQATEIEMPDGPRRDQAYECSNCSENIVISTIGDNPRPVQFEACPHCGEHGTVHAAALPDEIARKRQDFWSAA